MKTCLIFGQNGLDLDVAFNLVEFYKKLGFKTYFSEKLLDASLLVILRAVDQPIDISDKNYSQIHVYDYGGWSYDGCIESLPFEKTYIFTTAEKHRNHLISSLNFPPEQVYITVPPVETKLWVETEKNKVFNFVHIGNFKNIEEKDEIREKFNLSIDQLDTNLWGMGWNSLKYGEKYHGKAGLFDVSKIYSKSKYALGLMYPFQRDITFSGRFWHAPLNGCYLFSEPGLYTKEVPGVIETDYSTENILAMSLNLNDFEGLQKKAIYFWEEKNKQHQDLVLSIMDKTNFNNGFVKNYYKEKIINILRVYYQKYNLFKLINKLK